MQIAQICISIHPRYRHSARAAKPSNSHVTGGDKPQRGAGTVGYGIYQ